MTLCMKKRCRDGVIYLCSVCMPCLCIHLVPVVFGTAIPTSLNIFGKCFIYFRYLKSTYTHISHGHWPAAYVPAAVAHITKNCACSLAAQEFLGDGWL